MKVDTSKRPTVCVLFYLMKICVSSYETLIKTELMQQDI